MNELSMTALLLVVLGLLMTASVVASRQIDWLGVPIVLLFLVLGMLGRSEGIGGITFADHRFAFRVGTIALILILLDGGINTPVSSIRESIAPSAGAGDRGRRRDRRVDRPVRPCSGIALVRETSAGRGRVVDRRRNRPGKPQRE